jgi:hypothetical protein
VPNGPNEGLILKAEDHPTFQKTVAADKKLGYKFYRKDGRLYSFPQDKTPRQGFTPATEYNANEWDEYQALKAQELGARVNTASMATRGLPLPQVDIGPEHTFLSSEAGQDLINRGIMAPDSLTPDEQKQFKAAREHFPQVDSKAREYDQERVQEEQQQKSDLTTRGATGLLRAGADFVAESTKPISDYFKQRKAETPHPINPERDLKEKPLTPEEYNASRAYEAGNAAQKATWMAEWVANAGMSGTVDFASQTLDRIANAEKYGRTPLQAIGDVATGLAKMIAQAPDQVAGLAEAFFGTSNNPVTKLIEAAQAPATLATTGGIDRKSLRKEAMDALYEDPSSLPFALMMVTGAAKGSIKAAERIEGWSKSLKEVKDKGVEAGTITPEESATIDRVIESTKTAPEELTGKVKLEPEKGPTDVTPAPDQLKESIVTPEKLKETAPTYNKEPITQEVFDTAKERAKMAGSEIKGYESQIEGMETTLKTVRSKRDRIHLEPILKNWKKKLAENEKVLAEAEATMARPVQEVTDAVRERSAEGVDEAKQAGDVQKVEETHAKGEETAKAGQTQEVGPSAFEEMDLNKIPDDLEIPVKAKRAKTGEEITIKRNAKEALSEVDGKLDLYKKLMACLKA